MISIKGLHHVVIAVKDLDKSLAFYRDLLGLRVWLDVEIGSEELGTFWGVGGKPRIHSVVLQKDDVEGGMIELCEYLFPPGKPTGKATEIYGRGLQCVSFSTSDVEGLYNQLLKNGVEMISKLMPLGVEGLGTIRAFLCRDPDGVIVEIFEEHSKSEEE